MKEPLDCWLLVSSFALHLQKGQTAPRADPQKMAAEGEADMIEDIAEISA